MGYKIEKDEGSGWTVIRPTHLEEGMPEVEALLKVKQGVTDNHCMVIVCIDHMVTVSADVWRGKNFALRVTKHMPKGALSQLGRHRRHTRNKQLAAKEGK